MSELTVGLTIVAFGTSAPELAVSISAAFQGHSDISVSNVVGSNIFNLGFILGGVALFKTIKTNRKLVYRDGLFLLSIVGLIMLFLMYPNPSAPTLDRWEGIILLVMLFSYIFYLLKKKDAPLEDEIPAGELTWKDGPLLIFGILGVVAGGYLLVDSASSIAKALGVSEWVIGVTIVAAGTSAPELATSLMAVTKGRHGISAGNLIGSDIYNFLGVLGVASIIRPLSVNTMAMGSLLTLVGMICIVLLLMRRGWRLSKLDGAILIGLGALRWVVDFSGRGI